MGARSGSAAASRSSESGDQGIGGAFKGVGGCDKHGSTSLSHGQSAAAAPHTDCWACPPAAAAPSPGPGTAATDGEAKGQRREQLPVQRAVWPPACRPATPAAARRQTCSPTATHVPSGIVAHEGEVGSKPAGRHGQRAPRVGAEPPVHVAAPARAAGGCRWDGQTVGVGMVHLWRQQPRAVGQLTPSGLRGRRGRQTQRAACRSPAAWGGVDRRVGLGYMGWVRAVVDAVPRQRRS